MSQQEQGWKHKVDLFRKRFGAREDVFGVKQSYKKTDNSDPENPQLVEVVQYQPQCMNFGDQRVCLIAQNKGGCTTCDHKKYQPLTDEWLWKHISGQKELILYLVQKDGIKFGACDFDREIPFDDAKLVKAASERMGLPCYIARSTKKGYHLYWFFSEVIPAHFFTSLVDHIYREVGFMDRFMENPSNPPPEVFPKQTNFNPTGIGNGIKPPMIEHRFKEGFNCWVNLDATPVGEVEKQWEFFEKCEEISKEKLLKVLEDGNIPIISTPVGRSRRVLVNSEGQALPKDPIKPRGDFWKVIGGCPALKQFWEKDENGAYKVPADAKGDHAHRTASIAFAISTENGVQAIRERWGDRVEAEIEYAQRTAQHPHTCKALQQNGICRIGVHPTKQDHCMEKSPPMERVNGQLRVNPDNIPESEWVDPSPIRFATGYCSYEQLLKKCKEIIDKPPNNVNEELTNIIRLSWKLNPTERQGISGYISANKLMKANELKSLVKTVEKEVKEKEFEKTKEQYPHFSFDGDDHFQYPNGYRLVTRDAKGMPRTKELTNFTITITEELTLIKLVDLADDGEEHQIEKRWVHGYMQLAEKRSAFRAPSNEWLRDSSSFFGLVINVLGTGAMFKTENYNSIRNCVSHFNDKTKIIKRKVEAFGHYLLKGKDAYVTPSVIITKDEIKPNTEFELDLGNSETCRALDFKIIDDQQFKNLALHIISDYFECSTSIATMTVFAHALSASIISMIPLTKSPVVWVDGSYGQGKSFIAIVGQCFYGNFQSMMSSNSTAVGRLAAADKFRDAFLVVDDFKQTLSESNTKQIIQLIQSAYDRTGRDAATREGGVRENQGKVRGVMGITGEEPPLQEASAISRMLIVKTQSGSMNKEKGAKVKQNIDDYCGFTPYYIQYAYNLGKEVIGRYYNEYVEAFEKRSSEEGGGGNMFRISQNLAFNMTAFRVAVDLLAERGVIPVQKRDELCSRHMTNLNICREDVTAQTGASRGANLFLTRLKELLQDPARFHISNFRGFDPVEHRSSKPLGFYRASNPDTIYIIPGTAHGEVEAHLNKSKGWAASQHQVGRQLYEDGHLVVYDRKSTGYYKYVKTPSGLRNYCWAIKMSSLGFTPDGPEKKEENPLPDNVVKIAASE